MPPRISQVLVLSVLAGCTGSSASETVATFRVVDHLGEAVPGAEVTCAGIDLDVEGFDEVEGVVTALGTGVDFNCTIPVAAEDVWIFEAVAEPASAELIFEPTVTALRDVVLWRPSVATELVGENVVVSWEPVLDRPDPAWTTSRGISGGGAFGGANLSSDATSYTFPLEDLEDGSRRLTLVTTFLHEEVPATQSRHIFGFDVPPAPPVVPESRGASCQLLERHDADNSDGFVDELVDYPAGSCPLTDGVYDVFVQCSPISTCSVVEGTIDLGEVVPVRRIRVHAASFSEDNVVSASEDGVTYTELDAYDPLLSAAQARYVRIRSYDFLEISVFYEM
jgi:hypothetical protein